MFEMVYNEETKAWEQKQEPFITIEVETEEDFEFIGNAIAFYKNHINQKTTPKTHGDVIRSMSDKQLAEYVGKICLCSHIQDNDSKHCDSRAVCANCVAEWLQQPAEVDNATD